MKEQKLYVCEYCNTSYKEREKAKECEKNHKKITAVVDQRYLPITSNLTGKPDRICVQFSDGSCEWFKR